MRTLVTILLFLSMVPSVAVCDDIPKELKESFSTYQVREKLKVPDEDMKAIGQITMDYVHTTSVLSDDERSASKSDWEEQVGSFLPDDKWSQLRKISFYYFLMTEEPFKALRCVGIEVADDERKLINEEVRKAKRIIAEQQKLAEREMQLRAISSFMSPEEISRYVGDQDLDFRHLYLFENFDTELRSIRIQFLKQAEVQAKLKLTVKQLRQVKELTEVTFPSWCQQTRDYADSLPRDERDKVSDEIRERVRAAKLSAEEHGYDTKEERSKLFVKALGNIKPLKRRKENLQKQWYEEVLKVRGPLEEECTNRMQEILSEGQYQMLCQAIVQTKLKYKHDLVSGLQEIGYEFRKDAWEKYQGVDREIDAIKIDIAQDRQLDVLESIIGKVKLSRLAGPPVRFKGPMNEFNPCDRSGPVTGPVFAKHTRVRQKPQGNRRRTSAIEPTPTTR